MEPVDLTAGSFPRLGEVRLRPWRDDDRDAVFEAFRDPEIARFITQVATPTLALADAWLRTRHEGWRSGSLPSWALTAGGEVLGSVGLKRFDAARRRPPAVHADVTYWTHPSHRGQGLASAAAALVAGWAWTVHGIHRVELHHDVANHGSCQVAARAGFRLEGTLRQSFRTPAGWVDEHLHAAVRSAPD